MTLQARLDRDTVIEEIRTAQAALTRACHLAAPLVGWSAEYVAICETLDLVDALEARLQAAAMPTRLDTEKPA